MDHISFPSVTYSFFVVMDRMSEEMQTMFAMMLLIWLERAIILLLYI